MTAKEELHFSVRREIALLDQALALATNARHYRYETITRALEAVSFPYRIVQTWMRGKRGNFYYWTADWHSGSIYVNETRAGIPIRGIANAVKSLKRELEAWK